MGLLQAYGILFAITFLFLYIIVIIDEYKHNRKEFTIGTIIEWFFFFIPISIILSLVWLALGLLLGLFYSFL